MKLMATLAQWLWGAGILPRRLQRPLFKRLLHSHAELNLPFASDFFGLDYRGNLNNNIDFHIYFYGAFEKPLLYFLSDTMRALAPEGNGVFVDIGANIGQHSLYMSRHSARVYAFEPYTPVRERLLQQIAHSGVDNIQVHALGLSNSNTRLPFFAPTGNNAGIGSFDASTVDKGNASIGELELIRGDDFFAAEGPARLDLIKIDVEGFEKLALEGLQQTLVRYRPLLVCELSYGKAMSLGSLAELQSLLPEGYSLFTFDKRKADGSKARRRVGRARHSGEYRLVPYTRMLVQGQDDVVACPREGLSLLSQGNSQS